MRRGSAAAGGSLVNKKGVSVYLQVSKIEPWMTVSQAEDGRNRSQNGTRLPFDPLEETQQGDPHHVRARK